MLLTGFVRKSKADTRGSPFSGPSLDAVGAEHVFSARERFKEHRLRDEAIPFGNGGKVGKPAHKGDVFKRPFDLPFQRFVAGRDADIAVRSLKMRVRLRSERRIVGRDKELENARPPAL